MTHFGHSCFSENTNNYDNKSIWGDVKVVILLAENKTNFSLWDAAPKEVMFLFY